MNPYFEAAHRNLHGQEAGLEAAQVYATLAVAEEIRALREAIEGLTPRW